VLLLLYMSLQRVNFIRNVLPAFAVLGVFMGLGVLEFWELAQRTVSKALHGPDTPFSPLARRANQAAPALAMALTLGPGLYDVSRRAAQPVSDSRIKVGRWLDEHAKGRCQLLIPTQLVIDERDLQRCEVMRVDIGDKSTARQVRATSDGFTERYAIPGTFEDTTKSTRARNEAWQVLVNGPEPVFQAGRTKLLLAREPRRKSPSNPKLQLYRLKPRRN
jgi:hypothetical protein